MEKGGKFEFAGLVSTLCKTDVHLHYPYWAHPNPFYRETTSLIKIYAYNTCVCNRISNQNKQQRFWRAEFDITGVT